jgi:hypothetical protein
MKKLVAVLSLFVSMAAYGEDYWRYGYSNSIIWPASGVSRVGIGTGLPEYTLDVEGTIRMTGFRLPTGAHSGYVLTSNSSGVGTWQPVSGGGGSCLWHEGSGESIYYNGNVGIGTSSPDEKLEIADGGLLISLENPYIDFNDDNDGHRWRINEHHHDFRFELSTNNGSSWNEMLTISDNGDVGIGTISPSAPLAIAGLGASNGVPILVISENTSTDEFVFEGDFGGTGETGNSLKLQTYWGCNAMTWRGDGNVGIGTDNPAGKLEVIATEEKESGVHFLFNASHPSGNNNATTMKILSARGDAANDMALLEVANSISTKLYVRGDGNVGIGTTNPGSYQLAVNGHIRTKEITVETGWSDFVFTDNYQLMPLDRLEQHIKVNRSLPGIPTEKEVKENGIEVGEMQAKLLEKIEELTLYVIELKKENEDLRKANVNLEKRISVLEN